MKTLGKFVLIDNKDKKQILLDWGIDNMTQTQAQPFSQNMRYSLRKTLVSDLHSALPKQTSSLKPFSTRNLITSASTNQVSPFQNSNTLRNNTEEKNLVKTSKTYRSRSTKHFKQQVPKVDEKTILRQKVIEADRKKGKIISVMTMRRNGLRFKINKNYFVLSEQMKHDRFIEEVKKILFKEFMKIQQKKIYLFHLGKDPIFNVCTDVASKQYVIFADIHPKFNLPFELQMNLFQLASACQKQIRDEILQISQYKSKFLIGEEKINSQSKKLKKVKHQWEKIKNVHEYVNKLIDNPEIAKQLQSDIQDQDIVEKWCNEKAEKYNQERNQKEKNPFFDVKSHFPKETSNQNMLHHASNKINLMEGIQNTHEIKVRVVENLMEKVKRENELAEEIRKKEQNKIKHLGLKSQKQFLRQLQMKNIPLIKQNIPYIMQKYGMNRSEAYNLYNLYKSLQKISAMRLFSTNEFRRVKERGIDRKTFDEGLKGLEINPGDELIKNICYFPQFISWEEFIKIVSISMRKTPMSKLEALLEGMGNSQDGLLSKKQIDIMIGSSINKIFGHEEPELREHFVGVVMNELDKDKSGTIDIQQVKDHVMKRNLEDIDLITYLMLNS